MELDVSELMGSCCEACLVDKSSVSCREACPSETVSGKKINDIGLDLSELMNSCCETCPADKSSGSYRKVCPSETVSDRILILITS